jgi:short-subunit dehydrogenase
MKKLALHGRTVLVTGAARGLGRQLALGLAETEGANLILVDREEAGLEQLAAKISGRCSAAVRILKRDLLLENSARSLFDELEGRDVFGLVNNAGLTYYGPTEAAQLDLYRSIIGLDFRLVVELSLLFLSKFKAQPRGLRRVSANLSCWKTGEGRC